MHDISPELAVVGGQKSVRFQYKSVVPRNASILGSTVADSKLYIVALFNIHMDVRINFHILYG